MLPRASLHLQVPLLFMASSRVRVGAFDYLNVGHVRPIFRFEGEIEVPDVGEYPLLEGWTLAVPKGAELVCDARLLGGRSGTRRSSQGACGKSLYSDLPREPD